MRALTAALCADLDALLRDRDEARRRLSEQLVTAAQAKEQASEALEREGERAREHREDAKRAHERARQGKATLGRPVSAGCLI